MSRSNKEYLKNTYKVDNNPFEPYTDSEGIYNPPKTLFSEDMYSQKTYRKQTTKYNINYRQNNNEII